MVNKLFQIIRRNIRYSFSVFSRIAQIGISRDTDVAERANTVVANSLTVFFAIGCLLIYVKEIAFEYSSAVKILSPVLLLMLALPLYLNYRGQFLFSRMVLSCGPSFLILTSSVVTKVSVDDVTFNDFYNFRIILSVLCVLPLWIFALREFFALLITFAFNFSCLAFTDTIHHYFNVGYYDVGFMDKRYDFINITSVTTTILFTGGVLLMKRLMEQRESEKNVLVQTLKENNWVIENQNASLKQAQEKLNESFKQVENNNKSLAQELAVYDYEVSLFSYNVGHHLRGPVATISGLNNLLRDYRDHCLPVQDDILHHMDQSVKKLEDVIHDLNHILDIRKDVFRIKTGFKAGELVNEAIDLLSSEIKKVKPAISLSIPEGLEIFSSRSALTNILYHLLSNAIKFRDEKRPLEIHVKASRNDNIISFEILDNGLGIDLNKFRSHLYQMYKRFHLHVDGKGMGLYLVNLQVTALGGSILIDSEPNTYTRCAFNLPLIK